MTPLIPVLIGAGIWYAVKRNGKSSKNEVTEGEQTAFDKIIQKSTKNKAPLITTMNLQVSGGEKIAIGMGAMGGKKGLRKKAYALALEIQKQVPGSCPGAPVMLGKPAQSMKSIDGGYRVVTRWNAKWGTEKRGPVRPAVRDCMLRLLKKSAIGKRITTFKAMRA